MSINFKNGIYTGCILGICLLVFAFLGFKKITKQADDIAKINLQELKYEDLDGKEVLLSSFEGKYILINFWATWCTPCINEFPLLNETFDLVKNDFVFIVVSDENKKRIKDFAKENKYNFVYLNSDNLLMNGITSLPQTFILNKEGNKMYHHGTIFKGTPDILAKKLKKMITKN